MTVNNVSSAPVTISATVPAVETAPLVSCVWCSLSDLMTESPAWLIWSRLRCSGPLISQLRSAVDAVGHLFDETRLRRRRTG